MQSLQGLSVSYCIILYCFGSTVTVVVFVVLEVVFVGPGGEIFAPIAAVACLDLIFSTTLLGTFKPIKTPKSGGDVR